MRDRRQHRIYKIHRNENFWGTCYHLIFDKGEGLMSVALEGDGQANISNLSVLPDSRNKGLGTFMLRYAEKLAKKCGMRCISAQVEDGRNELLKWYEDRGYTIENLPIENYTSVEKYF